MSDIVKRLRQTWWSDDYGVSKDDLCDARNEEAANAADEIERLRQENATLTAEHDALRAERDEVRKSYCSLMEAYRGGDGRVTANKLGWGYLFEEDKP